VNGNPGGKNGLVISRENWSSVRALKGHEGPVCCSSFSPRLIKVIPRLFFSFSFVQEGDSLSYMVAIGSKDNAISLWKEGKNHALFAGRNLF